jgi:hypothetical protein
MVQCEQRVLANSYHTLHYTIQVSGGLEQDPQVFEGLHMLNSVTFKQKLLAWVSKIEHHDFCFYHVNRKLTFNIKLLEHVYLLLQSHL